MPLSDAFIVGEDWISEAYFTSDATKQSFLARVIERRKDWDGRKESYAESPLTRFSAVRGDLTALLIRASDENWTEEARSAAAAEAANVLEAALGFRDAGRSCHRDGPVTRVQATDIEKDVVALVRAAPVDSIEDLLSKETGRLAEAWVDEDGKEIAQAPARALSAIFADPNAPAYALVFAGRWTLIAERTRWAEGRYLAVDLQLVLDRNETKRGGEVDSTVAAIHSESFVPEADGTVWWDQTLDDSVKHTVGVSQDLREGIRHSIEVIANEVVNRRSARGLDPLPAEQAQTLAIQSLRFLYRILFLLFAEASPELEVLPVNAADYERGYSLDRLRELVQVRIETPRAKAGTHFYESLAVLFRLVDKGHSPTSGDASNSDGLTFHALRADLFETEATALIGEVGLGNAAMQQVLDRLLLSRAQSGKQRGFISYAELGINQLGAVYEGLMSYTGFFATEPLYEVAPNGDSSKGSWVVPVSRVDASADGEDQWIQPHFVLREDEITGAKVPVRYDSGEFVFRLAGRERQQSASYYTPEVLTRFTVSQALEELLDQDGKRTSAEEILQLTVCEPALGSGAFAIEAVRQLAEQYLARRQEELGERVDPEEYPRELQRVKAYIALHQVYGVDLNATAVELAEISLWLGTMAPGLDAPWFGLHLRRGNSLIGSRRAVHSPSDVLSGAFLSTSPRPSRDVSEESIFHFLLPSVGWGSTSEAKEGKELAPESVAALRVWRRKITGRLSKKQVETLQELSLRVERLWDLAGRRLEIADRESRRAIPVWGRLADDAGVVSREQIEASLADENRAYRRLHRVMDAWNALWFWPVTEAATAGAVAPSLDEWLEACRGLLGRHHEVRRRAAGHGQTPLGLGSDWTALGDEERLDLDFAGATDVAELLSTHPWLKVCERIAAEQAFFHWELDFAPIFSRGGGFDLQVGNPPWVRPRSDVAALLAEGDPWWQLALKPTRIQISERRARTLAVDRVRNLVIDGTSAVAALAAYVGSHVNYPHLSGLQPDLYRCFMEQTWRHSSRSGVIGLIHPETHFTDEKAGTLRAAAYGRLARHWQFLNALFLFEVHDQVSFGVHVYGASEDSPNFLMATSLYHPDTVERSVLHDGTGEEPGLKTLDGTWDLRPHRNRIIRVDTDTLRTWHAVLEDDSIPVLRTRMLYAVNTGSAEVLRKLSASTRIGSVSDLAYARGWDETTDRAAGRFDVRWGPTSGWDDVILQGPHIYVATPFYKSPNPTMLHNQDWAPIDLESLDRSSSPITSYKPTGSKKEYDDGFVHWGRASSRDYYRVMWRMMAGASTGERTLVPAIVPPGTANVRQSLLAIGLPGRSARELLAVAGSMSALLSDFLIRAAPKSSILFGAIRRLPYVDGPLASHIAFRTLRLNAMTAGYSQLWQEALAETEPDQWTGGLNYPGRPDLSSVSRSWDESSPLRRATDRRQALVEIDAAVAVSLGITADELCATYRTQFAVLYGYDRNAYVYDVNGRLVPAHVQALWRRKGDQLTQEELTATGPSGNAYTYELPFLTLDREVDMRRAYTHFERVMREQA